MSSRRFSAALRAGAREIWRRELEHPFVRGLGDGSLPAACFQFYMRQDYLFLIDYCRVFALAAAKAPDLATMRMFADLLHETLHTEMELHRQYCARVGISDRTLENTRPAPVTLGYTRHLLTVAHAGSVADIVAAVLPCQWGYAEIGQSLAARRRAAAAVTPYDEWINAYAAAEFAAGAEQLRALLDRITEGWPQSALAPLQAHFLTSSRWEYLFWDMAYAQSDWPI